MFDVLIKNAKIVSSQEIIEENLYIRDEKIAAVSRELLDEGAAKVIDAAGCIGFKAMMAGSVPDMFDVADDGSLLEIFRAHPEDICSLSCQGTRGSPALSPAAFFPELSALTGDTGGGQIIRRHPDRLRLVEVLDPRELSDIDRPEDLRG